MQATNKQLAAEVTKRSGRLVIKILSWGIKCVMSIGSASKKVWNEAREEAKKEDKSD